MNTSKNIIIKNYVFQVIYQLILILTPLLTLPYISKVLGAENIGIYSYDYSFLSYFLVISALGIDSYGNRSVARCRDNKDLLSSTFFSIWYSHLISSIIASLLYSAFVFFFVSVNTNIAWIMIIFIFGNLFDISWFYFGIEKISNTVVKNTAIKLLSLVLIFVFVKSSNDLWIYALILACSNLFGSLILWINLKKFVHFKGPSKKLFINFKPLIILALPVIAYSLYKYIDKIMIGNIINKIAVGYYDNSEKIINLVVGVLNSIGIVLLPKMSVLYSKDQKPEINQIIQKSTFFHFLCSCALIFGLAAVSPTLIPIFFGEDYTDCISLIQLLCIALFFSSFTNLIKNIYYIPNKKDKTFIIIMLVGCFIDIGCNAFLIPLYGINGAAIGTIITEICVFIMQIITSRKEIKFLKIFLYAIPFLCIGTIMFFSIKDLIIFEKNMILSLIMQVLIGAIIYITLAFLYLLILFKKNKNSKGARL